MKKRLFKKVIRITLINFAVALIALAVFIDKRIKFIIKPNKNELVFITPSVIRTEEFDNRLPHHAEIIYLEKDKSGVLQITEYLAKKEDVDAIRILSHGNQGFFELNGEIINRKYLAENGALFRSWKVALNEEADIMLYGCNIAATVEGRDLVKQLAELTGADVAAATHEVGGVLANWTLDFHTGNIETAILRMDDYEYHLDTAIVSNSNDSGAGTLRKAISDAASGDTIVFKLNAANDTIKLTSGELLIDKGLTIDGDNVLGSGDTVVVSGENTSRVINTSGNNITLKNMVVTKGNTGTGKGGGVYNNGHILNIEKVTVSACSASRGGGIYNKGTIDTISQSEISGNKATSLSGGGLYNYGTITRLLNVTVNHNRSERDGGGIVSEYGTIDKIVDSQISFNVAKGDGGGISNHNATINIFGSEISGDTSLSRGGGISTVYGTTNIEGSTISGNVSEGEGGGMYLYSGGYLSTINNATISGNKSDERGGGIDIWGYDNVVIINNSTISYNHCDADNSGGTHGGGLCLESRGPITIENTILVNNYQGNGSSQGDDYYFSNSSADLDDGGYNIVKFQDGASVNQGGTFNDSTDFIYSGTGNIWNHNNGTVTGTLNLAPALADNGGPTKTHSISTGSFADGTIPYSSNNGTYNDSEDIDQRGYYRALDGSGRDIGAYELGGTEPQDGDYLSQSNGLWSALSTWNIYTATDEWWHTVADQPTDTNNVVIAVNDTLTINAAAHADSLVLSKGSKLEITNSSILIIDDN